MTIDRLACQRPRWRAHAGAVLLVVVVAGSACSGGGRRPTTTPARPAAAASPVLLQPLFESGRYQEVISAGERTTPGPGSPERMWLTAHSLQRLNRLADARSELARLAAVQDAPWQVAARLATAVQDGDQAAIDRALPTAAAYPDHAFVQFELGLAYASRDRFTESAAALDRAWHASTAQAYAYYYAGLAYHRIKRTDLAASRLETFVRLAPQAPERPQVESILRTLGGR
jgi:tetratricopeptide (TPR) repeat protein